MSSSSSSLRLIVSSIPQQGNSVAHWCEMYRMGIPEPKVEHHEGRGIRICLIFPEMRPILDEASEIFGDKSEYVVAAPQYRAAANTAMGWKNANLRSEMTRLLRRASVSGWPRLFHSMRASRQTELQREFPLYVACSWLGNSPRIAQQSYLLVTCSPASACSMRLTSFSKLRQAGVVIQHLNATAVSGSD